MMAFHIWTLFDDQGIMQNSPTAANGKPPLSHEALRDVIDLSLWAGQLLLQHGADTQQVEETVRRVLEAQTARSGSGETVPAHIEADGMQIAVATRSLTGQITRTSVEDALEENKTERLTAPSNPLGSNGPVVVHG